MSKEQRDERLKSASNYQIAKIAHDAALWYKTVFLQYSRCFEQEHENAKFPFELSWNKEDALPFNADKLFFLIAINHTLDYIQDLNKILDSKNDGRLDYIVQKLLFEDDFYKKIKDLRNMNEHNIDYLILNGHNQSEFVSLIPCDSCSIITNANACWRIGNDEYIGNVNIEYIFNHMHEYRDEIIELLKTIFEEYVGG